MNLIPAVMVGALVVGATYVLITLGFTLSYRAGRVLNFAEGQLMLLGSYFFYTLSVSAHLPFAVALIGSILLSALSGVLLFQVFLRRLVGQSPLSLFLVTLGVAVVLTSVMNVVWGNSDLTVRAPGPAHIVHLPFHTALNLTQIAIIILAVLVYVVVLLLLRFLRVGIQMRATAEAPLLASQSGINIGAVWSIAWSMVGVTAALAGLAVAFTSVITPTTVQKGILGLAPAILAGLDSVEGVLLGSILIALLQTAATTYIGGDAADAAISVALLLILALRPYGLFGVRQVGRV